MPVLSVSCLLPPCMLCYAVLALVLSAANLLPAVCCSAAAGEPCTILSLLFASPCSSCCTVLCWWPVHPPCMLCCAVTACGLHAVLCCAVVGPAGAGPHLTLLTLACPVVDHITRCQLVLGLKGERTGRGAEGSVLNE